MSYNNPSSETHNPDMSDPIDPRLLGELAIVVIRAVSVFWLLEEKATAKVQQVGFDSNTSRIEAKSGNIIRMLCSSMAITRQRPLL